MGKKVSKISQTIYSFENTHISEDNEAKILFSRTVNLKYYNQGKKNPQKLNETRIFS